MQVYQHLNPIRFCLHAALLITMGMLSSATMASSTTPKPFHATYKANYNGIGITASRSLKQIDQDNLELLFEAKSWLAQITEFSHFKWDASGNLKPQEYQYDRRGLGRDRAALLKFDWQQNIVTNDVQGKSWQMPLPATAIDKLGYQLQLRNDLINGRALRAYQVADGGRIKTYEFELIGEEILETPVGQLKTTKVERIRKDSSRTTQIWFANDWDYVIVKLQQTEKDGKTYEINLSEASVDGQIVSGLTD